MAKQVSPGVLALRKVVDDVYADAREAKKQGKLAFSFRIQHLEFRKQPLLKCF